ncbi:hypothetical protein DFH06DRAFT_1137337 [Mycena polygramma]|nr:hypothetical protein DFH06DRAFT_1137337 [Mycena polygramma]
MHCQPNCRFGWNAQPANAWSTPLYEYEIGDDVTAKQKQPWWTLGTAAPFIVPPDFTCGLVISEEEHILELNILKYVMESAHGPCDQIANELANGHASTDPEVARHWQPLVNIINGVENLCWAPKKTLEEQKALIVQYVRANNVGNLQVAGITAADAPHLLKATNNYLKLTKDGTDTTLLPNIPTPNTMEVARKLDAAIALVPTFDGAILNAKVVDEWNRVLAAAAALAP